MRRELINCEVIFDLNHMRTIQYEKTRKALSMFNVLMVE